MVKTSDGWPNRPILATCLCLNLMPFQTCFPCSSDRFHMVTFYIIFFFFLILFQLFSENKNWRGKSGTLCICCKWLFTSGNLCLHWMWDWKVFPQIIEASGILCLGWSLFLDGCPRYRYWGTQQCSVLRSNSHTSMQTVLWSCYNPPPCMYTLWKDYLKSGCLGFFFFFFLHYSKCSIVVICSLKGCSMYTSCLDTSNNLGWDGDWHGLTAAKLLFLSWIGSMLPAEKLSGYVHT